MYFSPSNLKTRLRAWCQHKASIHLLVFLILERNNTRKAFIEPTILFKREDRK